MVLLGSVSLRAQESLDHDALMKFFVDWREFESPPLANGVPDYTPASIARLAEGLESFRERLENFDIEDWPVDQQVDWHVVRAEMNGLEFNIRVLKPWTRDPAFYRQLWTYDSDVPAHEGPINHATIEQWTYEFPLSDAAATTLTSELETVRPLLAQARGNLTGNARDLWVASVKKLRTQVAELDALAGIVGDERPSLSAAIADARAATVDFADWLESKAPEKTGPSGIGKDNYSWMLQHVHLIPMTWEDEVMLLRRELKRAHASLRLEEHRNRDLPPLPVISSPEEWERRVIESVDDYIAFLDENDIRPMKDYLGRAILKYSDRGGYAPPDNRNFFSQATHRDPTTLWTHFYHWWDIAELLEHPTGNPIRDTPLLYNIFDSRSEGMATAMEEMMMHVGLYEDRPRVREAVWIMLAQRAARGLASLYAHANEFTMKDASDFHVAWTPRGWMSPSLDLLGSEQLLYLRQPGYGTSYVTGKHLMEELFAEKMRQEIEVKGNADYSLYDFFEELDESRSIPVSLIRWEMTGNEEVRSLGSEPLPPQ
jgi:hypothetical protein